MLLPEHVFLLVVPHLALFLHQLPQPTAQLFRFGAYRWPLWWNVTPHPCVLSPSAALDALAPGGTLSQELLLPCAPHLVQMDRPFSQTKPCSCYRSAAEKKGDVGDKINFCDSFSMQLTVSFMLMNINLCPSCLQTTAAFRSFQPESQILPQSPWRYTSTRPSFLLLPPTRRTRGPNRKKDLDIHVCPSTCSSLRVSFMSTDSVESYLQPGMSLFHLHSHSNHLCVPTGDKGNVFILSAVSMWHLNHISGHTPMFSSCCVIHLHRDMDIFYSYNTAGEASSDVIF